MRRLKGLILIFMAALTIPLVYFIFQSYRSFDQEEAAELRYFAETLFDEMEQVMAALVRREERRPVDAYNSDYTPPRRHRRESSLPSFKTACGRFHPGLFSEQSGRVLSEPAARCRRPFPGNRCRRRTASSREPDLQREAGGRGPSVRGPAPAHSKNRRTAGTRRRELRIPISETLRSQIPEKLSWPERESRFRS